MRIEEIHTMGSGQGKDVVFAGKRRRQR